MLEYKLHLDDDDGYTEILIKRYITGRCQIEFLKDGKELFVHLIEENEVLMFSKFFYDASDFIKIDK